jgi:putative ABC transport system ATP-binding protein
VSDPTDDRSAGDRPSDERPADRRGTAPSAAGATTTLEPPAIEAIDVRKTFDRGLVVALDGLTMTVGSGEYVAVTGRSGCGKSTLMHLLAALDHPDSGTLRVRGRDITHPDHVNRYRRHEVGLVFQMHNLLPHLDARSNIAVAMMGTHTHRHERAERARELLELVELGHLGHRRPPEMSGGERQRVAIARALANRPGLLLADEPTGSLDSRSVDLVLGLMEHLRAEEDVTIVVVTHDPHVAEAADRTIHMADGKVVEDHS